jgi:glutamine cyclotransferase
MDDIRDRLKVLDDIDMPNLWDRPESAHRPVAGVPSPARRVAIAVLAVAIASAGIGFAMVRLAEPAPESSPASSIEPLAVHAEITATIDTGKPFPEGVAVGEDAIWVATRSADQSGDVIRLDPVSGEIIARIPVSSLPGWEFGGAGITTGLGYVWVLGNEEDGLVLHQIDPASDEVTKNISVGQGSASDVWADATGVWVLASTGTHVYTLYRLDPSTLQVTQRIDVAADWSNSVFAAGGWLWVLGDDPDRDDEAPPETLTKLDPGTGSVVGISQPTDGDAFFATPSADRIWFWHDGLRALDASTGQQIAGPIDVPSECCASELADGTGGVWVITNARSGRADDAGIWHVNRDGVVDRHADVNLGPKSDGVAGAFDPTTDSVWVVHFDTTVSQVQITPAESQLPSVSATNTGQ